MTNTSFARACFQRVLTFGVIAGLASSASVAASQTGTATAFYMTYRTAFDKAQKIEDLLPYLAAKNRQDVQKTPADDRVKFFMMMKMLGTMKDVKVVKTTKTGNGQTRDREREQCVEDGRGEMLGKFLTGPTP